MYYRYDPLNHRINSLVQSRIVRGLGTAAAARKKDALYALRKCLKTLQSDGTVKDEVYTRRSGKGSGWGPAPSDDDNSEDHETVVNEQTKPSNDVGYDVDMATLMAEQRVFFAEQRALLDKRLEDFNMKEAELQHQREELDNERDAFLRAKESDEQCVAKTKGVLHSPPGRSMQLWKRVKPTPVKEAVLSYPTRTKFLSPQSMPMCEENVPQQSLLSYKLFTDEFYHHEFDNDHNERELELQRIEVERQRELVRREKEKRRKATTDAAAAHILGSYGSSWRG